MNKQILNKLSPEGREKVIFYEARLREIQIEKNELDELLKLEEGELTL